MGTPKACRSVAYSTPISSDRAASPVRALAASTIHSSSAVSKAPSTDVPPASSTGPSTTTSATGSAPRLATGVREDRASADSRRRPSR